MHMRLLLQLVMVAVCAAIYPSDHWSFATKMTVDNFDSVVKQEVDAGKTLFVRWIASPG
jgi:hypothetical protein